MHSRKRGKSSSSKPLTAKKHTWQSHDREEITQLIIKLAKAQKSASQIGIELRDSYGIPNVQEATKKSITQILEAEKLLPKLPESMLSLVKRHIIITKHLQSNKQDKPSLRGLQLTESKIRRLAKYYKRIKKLPQDWRFSREQASLLIE
jgi:small subunit ribosomal protein S15